MFKKIGIGLVVAAIVASMTVSSVLACTTRTPGYWKNHSEAWPTTGTIRVGTTNYDLANSGHVDALLDILWTVPKGGDAWIKLAQKVIAAQLSMLVYEPGLHWDNPVNFGGYHDGMVGLVDDANDLLADPNALKSDMIWLAGLIDYYLNYWNEYMLND